MLLRFTQVMMMLRAKRGGLLPAGGSVEMFGGYTCESGLFQVVFSIFRPRYVFGELNPSTVQWRF